MNYFWITQKPKSHKEELENGWIRARPAKIYNQYRETVKSIKKGDLIFFCSSGVISHIGFALGSVMHETDEKGILWTVKFKSHQLEMPIEIRVHKEYLLDKRAKKYSPITSFGKAHQGYCSEINKVTAWFLLSRAGVYYNNDNIIELEKAVGYREAKSASSRVSNLNSLMSKLERRDILDVLGKFEEIQYTDYKFQKSTTYDLEYNGNLFPPKVIFGVSAIAVINRVLFADEFTGGLDSVCFKVLTSLGFNIIDKSVSDVNSQKKAIDLLIEDIYEIEKDANISITDRKQLIDARVGQGKFRSDLNKLYGKCLLTDISLDVMLRASHIKPWRESSNYERLDPYNGLLLSANIDILFDKGLISFKANGELLISPVLIENNILELIGIHAVTSVKINEKCQKYLGWHRNKYFPSHGDKDVHD